jgi:hypothetical protein
MLKNIGAPSPVSSGMLAVASHCVLTDALMPSEAVMSADKEK